MGVAGPTDLRADSFLPIAGSTRYDRADVDALQVSGQLDDLILHGMGYVLGIGTLWTITETATCPPIPQFRGEAAVTAYLDIFTNSPRTAIPLEPGCRRWRELALGNELMTGFLDAGTPNPLSIITVGSLQDLGYEVDFTVADEYTPPSVEVITGPKLGRVQVLDQELQIWPSAS